MKKEAQTTTNNKLTIFKPPSFIYKLCKSQQKQLKNPIYQIHQNDTIRVRKYHHQLANNQQFAIYQWRKNVEQPVVKVLYVELCRQMGVDKQNKNIGVNVYTEHLQKTLADIINFNINEALYLFREALLGYQAIFCKFSAVSIHKSYIGLNVEGKLKVWLSQNLAFNYSKPQQNANQYFDQQVFNSQPAIVRKIIHMMTLLSAISCKGFFTDLGKHLQIKKYSFSNCLQYINHFASIANKIQIPENLQYLLQKRTNPNMQKSTFKMTNSRKINNQNRQRKLSQNLNEGIKTFKHFATVSRFKENTQNDSYKWQQKSQTTYKFQQNSQNKSKNRLSFIPRSKSKLPQQQIKESTKSKQQQISLHLIVERNDNNKSNKYFQAQKSNNCLEKTKSNSSLARHRPSISLMPTFLIRISNPKINEMKESLHIRRTNKSISTSKRNSVDAQSLFNSKAERSLTAKMLSGHDQKLVISQMQSKNFKTFDQLNPYNQVNQQQYLKLRGRSASQSVKLQQNSFPRMLSSMHQRTQQAVIQRQSRLNSQASGKQKPNKVLSSLSNKKSSSSNQQITHKKSFLTKTNYESSSSSRMNFSSLSIQNKTIQPLSQLVNKSLVKYGFQGILDNPSCKEVDEEQSRSYNSSELKNTHNLADFVQDKENSNNIGFNQNWSFGKNSSHVHKRLMLNDDSEHALIKQKNDQVILKNQWRKTINNLQMSGDLLLNQSIIDFSEDVVERDNHPQIKLEKLDRLGGDMCFSIVRKSDDVSIC